MFIQQWGGKLVFETQYLRHVDGYNSTTTNVNTIQDWQDKAFEQLLVMLFLLECDITKYRTKIDGLHNQKNLKNNQYPKTLDDAIYAIGGMKFDKEYYDTHKK